MAKSKVAEPGREATMPGQHVVILASAGSGKTHQLSSRYLRLIQRGQPLDRILATTFTRKAAGEILDRVLLRLAKSVVSEPDRHQLCEDLAQDVAVEKLRELLVELTRNLHRIRISTLDAYFGQVARTFGLELGLPADWTILDAHDDQRVRRQAITELLSHQSERARQLMHLLTKGDAQRAVTSMLLETVNEVYELYQESSVDGHAAWKWIPERPLLTAAQQAAALRAFAAVVLPKDSLQKPHQAALVSAEAGDWEGFASKGLAKALLHEGTYYKWKISDELKAVYQPFLDMARAEAVNRLVRQTRGACELAGVFGEIYDPLKIDEGAILFNDVPQYLSRLAERPPPRQMAYRMDSQIDHLLLDEFQDTSVSQWETLLPLAKRITLYQDQSHSFFCVGDTKQAIYGWRGGQADILENMDRQLPHITVDQLNDSRRSSPVIIAAVNQVFENRLQHSNLGPYQQGFESWVFPHHTTTRDTSGYVCLEVADADEDDVSGPLAHAARRVRELYERAPGHSIGVLVRRNQTVGELIYQLREQQVPASEEGGNPLTDSAAVQQLLALLHFVDHPCDSLARFHFASGPLGPALSLSPLAQAEPARTITEFVRDIRRELLDRGYGPCVAEWARSLTSSCSSRELLRMSQLVDMAYDYQSRATLRTSDFVRYVQTQRVADPSTASVRVMTIHQSKGLEFDTVVLTALEQTMVKPRKFAVQRCPETFRPWRICRYAGESTQSLLPAEMRAVYDEDVRRNTHEYLCSLYVAMTRAKRALYMIVAPDSAKSDRRTTAGLLRATLAAGTQAKAGTIMFAAGEREWYEPEGTAEALGSAPATHATRRPRRLRLKDPAADSPTARPTVLPSPASHGSPGPIALFSSRRQEALHFGSLVHTWLEHIEWLAAPLTSERLREIARHRGFSRVDLEKAVPEFLGMLARPAVGGLLEEAEYLRDFHEWFAPHVPADGRSSLPVGVRLEVRNEQRIVYRSQGQVMTGSIDRLVLGYKNGSVVAADILDWKTDPVADETERLAQATTYAGQLAAYRSAIRSMFDVPDARIRTRLVFLRAGAVESIGPPVDAR